MDMQYIQTLRNMADRSERMGKVYADAGMTDKAALNFNEAATLRAKAEQEEHRAAVEWRD